jgi:branched-chain amino acid aminotransferase
MRIIQTVRANKLKDRYIRVVVTRGVGDLGLDPRKCKNPHTFYNSQ